MSWGPPEKPYSLIPYYNTLVSAVMERCEYFKSMDAAGVGVLDYISENLKKLETPYTRFIDDDIFFLQESIYRLLVHSLDARQIGGWVDFKPFVWITSQKKELIDGLLQYMELPENAWWFEPPYSLGKLGNFFTFCYRLLNEIILYPQINAQFLLDGSWEVYMPEYGVAASGRLSKDGYFEGYYPSGVNGGYHGAYYEGYGGTYALSKVFFYDMQMLNRSQLRFSGKWQMRYRLGCYDLRAYFPDVPEDEQEQYRDHGSYHILNFNGDISDTIPVPNRADNWISEIRALPDDAVDNLPYWSRFARASPSFERKALLTWENMPRLNYKYME